MNYFITFNNSEEEHFYSCVFETISKFESHHRKNSLSSFEKTKILVFLPVIPRARFLIHKCVESFSRLSSISVGKGISRRVVIYFKQYSPSTSSLLPPSSSKSCLHVEEDKNKERTKHHQSRMSSSFPRNDSKRPDQAIYIPRQRRDETSKELNKEKAVKSVSTNKKFDETKTISCTNVECTKKKANHVADNNSTGVETLFQNMNLKDSILLHRAEARSAEVVAAKMSLEILNATLDVLPSAISELQIKRPERNSRRRRQQLSGNETLLPGMATNFVNIAIENALELMKSVKLYEKNITASSTFKSNQPETHSAGIELANSSKEVIEENKSIAEDNSEPVRNSKEVNDSCSKAPIVNSNRDPKEIEKSQSKTKHSTDSPKKGKSAGKNSKNKNNKISKALTDKSKDEKPIRYGSKLKKNKKKNNDIQTPPAAKEMSETSNSSKSLVPEEREETKLEESNTENLVEELDDWDANWTEDGECLNKDMVDELSSLTGIKNPSMEKAEGIDYLNFTPTKKIELDAGEFGHILELFDFSPQLKTQEIFNALSSAGIKDVNITWVDDTHALAVFASQAAAHLAMKQYVPILQMRQVVNGTRDSKAKARDFKDSLLPYKKRPATTGMVARNLVAGALGIRTNVSSEQRKKEKEMLKEAREERRQKKKQKNDVWENPD